SGSTQNSSTLDRGYILSADDHFVAGNFAKWVLAGTTLREPCNVIYSVGDIIYTMGEIMQTYTPNRTQGKRLAHGIQPAMRANAESGAAMKILMVDDDPSLVKILSFLLRDEGYEVVTATTGTEALQVLQQEWVDMVILD